MALFAGPQAILVKGNRIHKYLHANHNLNIIGVTETRLHPKSKIRTEYFAINAPRPPPLRGQDTGGVSFIFWTLCGVRLIFKHAEKKFQLIIAQLGKVKCGIAYLSPKSTKIETQKALKSYFPARKRKNNHVRGLE